MCGGGRKILSTDPHNFPLTPPGYKARRRRGKGQWTLFNQSAGDLSNQLLLFPQLSVPGPLSGRHLYVALSCAGLGKTVAAQLALGHLLD